MATTSAAPPTSAGHCGAHQAGPLDGRPTAGGGRDRPRVETHAGIDRRDARRAVEAVATEQASGGG